MCDIRSLIVIEKDVWENRIDGSRIFREPNDYFRVEFPPRIYFCKGVQYVKNPSPRQFTSLFSAAGFINADVDEQLRRFKFKNANVKLCQGKYINLTLLQIYMREEHKYLREVQMLTSDKKLKKQIGEFFEDINNRFK